jgi:hypothetical protein
LVGRDWPLILLELGERLRAKGKKQSGSRRGMTALDALEVAAKKAYAEWARWGAVAVTPWEQLPTAARDGWRLVVRAAIEAHEEES